VIYIPEKFEYMPKKKIVLARASTRYEKLDEELIKKINDLYLEGLSLSSPTIWYETFNIEELPKSLIPGKFKGVKKITLFVSTLGEEIDKKIEHYTENGEVLRAVIKRAINILSTCNCSPSCYRCLRSYENQKFHEILDREKALSFLKQLDKS